jgi:hypothetical protein
MVYKNSILAPRDTPIWGYYTSLEYIYDKVYISPPYQGILKKRNGFHMGISDYEFKGLNGEGAIDASLKRYADTKEEAQEEYLKECREIYGLLQDKMSNIKDCMNVLHEALYGGDNG